MRNRFIATAVLMLGVFSVSFLSAQNAGSQKSSATIPDLSGVWDTPYSLGRNDICGEPTCRVLGNLPIPQPNIPLEEPQMTPWSEEKYQAAHEDAQDPKSPVREEANPWFSACAPAGPALLMLTPFIATELRQFPDVVLLFFTGTAGEGDHTVRRIYVDGRGHPANWKHTAMGHSIGRYDGGTLIVDTIGISDTSWLDPQGHPHSDALHLVERFQRLDRENLEYEITIEDPKAYKNSWRRKVARRLSPPAPRFWDATNCEEILQMGTHYGAEARQ